MQHWPLLTSRLIEHAQRYHAGREIVGRDNNGHTYRTDWATIGRRSRALADALERWGVREGDRCGSLAWNSSRHIECWYGVPGIGAIMHTINPRLSDEQISYIIEKAGDRLLFVDACLLPLLERILDRVTCVEAVIVLDEHDAMPESADRCLCYEDLLLEGDPELCWPQLSEEMPAGLCFTSGTTGKPKGALYTHRSTVLHAMAVSQVDVFAIGGRSVVLPIVPMYHANGWGIPHGAAAMGAKLVLNGRFFDPATLLDLILEEKVTFAAGVPTVWLSLLGHLKSTGSTTGALRRIVSGGSALPAAVLDTFEKQFGVEVMQAWGMTEMSPLGTACALPGWGLEPTEEHRRATLLKQGRPVFGVELALLGPDGEQLPHDGVSAGRVIVRGPWVIDSYYDSDEGQSGVPPGWFETGDIASVDPLGYMRILDRAKDIIKSGGEWISSLELERVAESIPGVRQAAAVAIADERWGERPVLFVVVAPQTPIDPDLLRAEMSKCLVRWSLPDHIIVIDQMPLASTGKVDKVALRTLACEVVIAQRLG
jgi:acyl-CoA synthetase (AMP-forming)/AMP-acid ligase II